MNRTDFPEEVTFEEGVVANHIDVHGKDNFGKGNRIYKSSEVAT